MFVLRPASAFHSQPVWQQPAYEPFSAFLAPSAPTSVSRHRQQQLAHVPTRHASCFPAQSASYLPSAFYHGQPYEEDDNERYCDDEDEVEQNYSPYHAQRSHDGRVGGSTMEALLMARVLQEQRRQEAEEAARAYQARVLRERQRQHALEQQLLAERARQVALARQQQQRQQYEQQLRRQQQLRQAEAERQRREQQQAEAFTAQLREALGELLYGQQADTQQQQRLQQERAGSVEHPTVRLLLRRSGEQAKETDENAAASTQTLSAPVTPATPTGSTSSRPHSPVPIAVQPAVVIMPASASPSAATISSPAASASSSPSPARGIRFRTVPITSHTPASAPASPLRIPLSFQHSARASTPSPVSLAAPSTRLPTPPAPSAGSSSSSKRPAAPSITIPSPSNPSASTATVTPSASAPAGSSRSRRGSVEIEDVPSSPDRLKVDADEDVWAVEKRLHTPTPATVAATASPAA